jgi:hypothetical protein
LEPSADVAFQLQTPSGPVLGEAEIETEPSMSLVAELRSLRRKVVRVEQPEAGVWELWSRRSAWPCSTMPRRRA